MYEGKGYRFGALGCCLVYLLAFLLLPLVTNRLMLTSASGIDCLSVSVWAYLVLAAGIAAAVCTLIAPPKAAAAVCLAAAFIAIFSFFLLRKDTAVLFASYVGGGMSSGAAATGITVSSVMGYGPVLAMLCGIAAAVLCFLSGRRPKTRQITPGLTANPDDEW